MTDESRVNRARQFEFDDAVDKLDTEDTPSPIAVVMKTTTVTTYPTSAMSYYACIPADVYGTETEGSSVSLSTSGYNTTYAANIGSAIPASGTYVICYQVAAGRWVFEWN